MAMAGALIHCRPCSAPCRSRSCLTSERKSSETSTLWLQKMIAGFLEVVALGMDEAAQRLALVPAL